MARVFRSPLARRDIVEVLRYTRDRWGKEQAREYRNLIREALNAIAAEPQLGKVRGTRPGNPEPPSSSLAGMPAISCSIE